MDKETKLRSALFFVIGFLLVLSLIICIYIVAGERDLEPIEAEVSNIVKDSRKTGVNTIKITYTVDATKYNFAFDTKKEYEIGEKINVYYHTKKVTDIQTYKTSKLIFLCPIFGLLLCALGLFELYRKKNDGEAEFKTSIIGVVGDTQQLKIVTEETEEQPYEPTPEESAEVEVKTLSRPVAEEIPAPIEEAKVEEEVQQPVAAVEEVQNVAEPEPEPKVEEAPTEPEEPVAELQTPPEPVELPKEQPKMVSNSVEDDIVKKVKEKSGDKIEVSEAELKEAIKDVLADVIKEVKQEKKPKKVEQVRVLPNYYYISGTSLMYEEAGKEQKELSLKDIKNVVRTINEAGNVVKLTVESDEVKCILTNMKNIDLEQLSNLLRNKLRAMDENFEEVIEHKEY